MYQFRSIRNELTVLLSAALAVILLVISIFHIQNVSQETRIQVEKGLQNALAVQALEIETFIRGHGEVVDTMLSSPQLIEWFSLYNHRNKDLSEDQDYPQIVQLFKNLQKRNDSTKAVFFASALTGEYFDSANDRYSGDGTYYATKRPWWAEATAVDQLFITQPEVDYVDKTVVSSIKRTVYNDSGQLIGIGGVDILLSTIQEKIGQQLKYEEQGEAFIFNRDGRIILFPSESDQVKDNTDIALVDKFIDGASGFSALKQSAQKHQQGLIPVSWRGEKHLVAFKNIALEKPLVNWVAGIIISEQIINDPIETSVQDAMLAAIIIWLIISATVFLTTQRIVKPLKRVAVAIYDVAHGEGDLTHRIQVESHNEVGEFAQQFNIFVERIHQIIRLNQQTVEELYESAEKVSSITNLSAQKAEMQRASTDMVATAAEELSYSVKGVSANSHSASQSADEADSQVVKGLQVVAESTESIKTLAQTMEKASSVVDNVSQSSAKIGEVLEVIRSIAEQTNLLALNAAIEAARAGDQGRGFAVVADEVRSLASRTQESTESIHRIIEGLQSHAADAVLAMSKGNEHVLVGVEKSELVQGVLSSVARAISEIKQQSIEIASSTKEQAKASEEITERAASIRKLSEEAAEQIVQVQAGTRQQREDIHKLAELVGKFKV